ncbi:hypothetical protein [Actinocorallia populi]|uniref:hypothetical protein n=1 Tax=Actinocorallia populi TaxID=2079200 RepID=UPI000D090D28|nr:hypothetical protein [Actinocorallia populi]
MNQLLTQPFPVEEQDFAELADEIRVLLTGAVDTLEVAAGLEAKGIGDKTAHRYGQPDVFALAARLYESTVRRPAFDRPAANPWLTDEPTWRRGGRHVLRGLLFGLPGMGYVAAGPLLGRPSAGLVLTLALVACWPLGQGLAALASSRPDPGAARSVLRYGVLAGTTAMAVICVVFGALFGADTAVVAVACAQSLYLLAATAALVTGGEIWLLAVLLPGLSVSFAGPPWQLVLAGWTVTGLGVLVLAYERTRDGTGTGVSWASLRIAVPYALFGLLAGGLLTFTIVAAYTGYGEPPPTTSIAMVALSLAMGPAEWVLYGFRARGHDLLQESHSLQEFGWHIRVTLLELVVRFLAVLAVLLGLAFMVAEASRGTLQVAACSLLLGGALFVALMLQSCGRATASLVCCAVALVLETAALVLAAPPPVAVQLGGAAGLFTVLLAYAVVVLGRATAHR